MNRPVKFYIFSLMESYIVDKVTYVDIVKRLIKCYSSIRFDESVNVEYGSLHENKYRVNWRLQSPFLR